MEAHGVILTFYGASVSRDYEEDGFLTVFSAR